MSKLYNRSYRLEIDGESETTIITGLRMNFICNKSRATVANDLVINVYNPNKDTIAKAGRVGASVRLYAGYEDEINLIADAQITTSNPLKQGVDLILKIECLDGMEFLKKTKISLSFAAGSTALQVLDSLRYQLAIPIEIAPDVETKVKFINGYSYAGGIAGALDEVCSRAKATWSILNGTLVVVGIKGKLDGQAFYLSPNTGLIGSPTPIEDSTNSLTVGEIRRGWSFTTLLQGMINPFSTIEIDSLNVQGQYLVEKVEHKGDTHSQEWYSTVLCYEDEYTIEYKEKVKETDKQKKKEKQAANTTIIKR